MVTWMLWLRECNVLKGYEDTSPENNKHVHVAQKFLHNHMQNTSHGLAQV